MKKSSLVLVALLLAAPVFADEAKAEVAPLTLASADTSASTNLQVSESTDLAARLDKEAKEAVESLTAKVKSDLAASIAKDVIANVKF